MSSPLHTTATSDPFRILSEVFGFDRFRPNQEEIVQAILAGEDAFVVMPTGGGKSLCYQLPAHLVDGTCMVISPLISLMKDQVDAAVANGLKASLLNSSLTAAMKRAVEQQLLDGELDLIYVSPERFAMPAFMSALKRVNLSFVAIDEAHCVSEWGHDFRPDYLNLASLTREFPGVPVSAFTATATHRVQDDIVRKLGLRSPHVVRASFNRPNLFYKVVPKHNPSDQILRYVRSRRGDAGIIYRTTRKNVAQTADMLVRNDIKAVPYHAGLDDATRVRNQDAFNKDDVDVVVATIAFGMGIDKSNVRYVLHADLPKNIEGYYQETGRAGRDGEPAHCLLLFGYGDIPKIRFFTNQVEDETERAHQVKCLNDMVHYATVHACRRKQLLGYFGETWPPLPRRTGIPARPGRSAAGALLHTSPTFPCCDICEGEVESVDATRDAQIVMSAIARTGQRFGIGHVIAVVSGDQSDRMLQLGHDQIKTYGAGKNKAKQHWRLIIDNLLAKGLILQTADEYPVLHLQPESREVLFNGRAVTVLKTRKPTGAARRRKASASGGPYNEELFEQLRDLRKQLATKQGVPPYVVFSDKTLHEMARHFPATDAELLCITGIGASKLDRYGEAFLMAVAEFRQANPGVEPLVSESLL